MSIKYTVSLMCQVIVWSTKSTNFSTSKQTFCIKKLNFHKFIMCTIFFYNCCPFIMSLIVTDICVHYLLNRYHTINIYVYETHHSLVMGHEMYTHAYNKTHHINSLTRIYFACGHT